MFPFSIPKVIGSVCFSLLCNVVTEYSITTVKKNLPLSVLRITALTILFAGAVASLGFMFQTGRNNKSVLLILLFMFWVLSPFIALLVASIISKQWSVFSRVILYILMIILTLGSLSGYSGILNPAGTKPAFIFLVTPFISWLFLVLVVPIAAAVSRRFSQKIDAT